MFQRISAEQLKQKIDTESLTIVDVRDPNSYFSGHISNALLLDNNSVGKLIETGEYDKSIVVCCYHGNSSQGAAQYLFEQGFKQAYSLDGGFEVWKIAFPDLVESNV
ncbi:MAG: thiosulfate sulfurtransferase [Bermanella sp.]|jgi:thiosulfate sulfurtransferase